VAQKVQTLFIDDIDGSAAEGTVRFGLDGTEYEIDLNAEHAQQLRDALASYVRAGRRVSGGSRRPARGGRRGPASGLNTTEVREWAKAQGIQVKDRGRVPAELVVRFKAATTEAPAGRNEEFRDAYQKLARPPISHVVTALLSEDQWVKSNLLLDQGLPEADVARQVGIPRRAITMMSNPRRCLDLHDGDIEALARCLDADK
jgi:hypothetical protein